VVTVHLVFGVALRGSRAGSSRFVSCVGRGVCLSASITLSCCRSFLLVCCVFGEKGWVLVGGGREAVGVGGGVVVGVLGVAWPIRGGVLRVVLYFGKSVRFVSRFFAVFCLFSLPSLRLRLILDCLLSPKNVSIY